MEEENLLSNSCETYVLENGILISSYPSLIVFGKTESNKKYIEDSSFKFNTFQVAQLFKSIIAIVAFFNDNVEHKMEKILDFSCDTVYYWKGDLVTEEDNTKLKLIKLGIEKKGDILFNATFSLQNINSFVYLLNRCLISSLCLKDNEEQFILSAIPNSKCEIKACKTDDSIAFKIVQNFFNQKKIKAGTKRASYLEILKYYNSIILLIKDLTSLYYPND
jgi:hypothetical protein